MSQINRTGTYRGIILDAGVYEDEKNGLPVWNAQLQATEYYDEETKQWVDWTTYEEKEVRAYLYLFSKKDEPIFHYKQLQKALEWSGIVFSELVTMDYSGKKIQFRVEQPDPDYGLKVTNVDAYDAEPGRTLKKLDLEGIKKLDARYANALRQASGGPKPKPVEQLQRPAIGPAGQPEVRADTSGVRSMPVPAKTKKTKSVVPETCTKEQAWNSAYEVKAENITDDQISNIWLTTIETKGGEKAIDDWSIIRDLVIEQVKSDDEIPF